MFGNPLLLSALRQANHREKVKILYLIILTKRISHNAFWRREHREADGAKESGSLSQAHKNLSAGSSFQHDFSHLLRLNNGFRLKHFKGLLGGHSVMGKKKSHGEVREMEMGSGGKLVGQFVKKYLE